MICRQILFVVLALNALALIGSSHGEEVRHVEDIRLDMRAGEDLLIGHGQILEGFKNPTGEASVTRFLMRPGRSGSVQIRPGAFLYTPDEGFIGEAVLTFQVRDDEGSQEVKIFIVVEESEDQ